MTEKYASKPFAIVGINSDGDRSALQKIISDNKINYRNAVDGSTSGPIAKQYNVHGWPTVYVLDEKGVIRAKMIGVDPNELTKVVEELLSKLK